MRLLVAQRVWTGAVEWLAIDVRKGDDINGISSVVTKNAADGADRPAPEIGLRSRAASSGHHRSPLHRTSWGDAMSRNQQTRPLDEGIDPSNEKIVLDQIKLSTEEKRPSRNGMGPSESDSTK